MTKRFKHPLDKIRADVQQRVFDAIALQHDSASEHSPLEGIMSAALYAWSICNLEAHCFDKIEVWTSSAPLPEALPSDPGVCCYIFPQVPILNDVADFVVFAPKGEGWSKLVVECDGHDFHERTKEQAAHDRARDRSMQEAGYTVFRFTGAEIYRDPIACARQVIAWAMKETFG